MIRLTGFGPFGEVTDNPSARLVLALTARAIAGHRVETRILPVRWRDGLDAALRGPPPALLLGFGVATTRDRIEVEAVGTAAREGLDVDGCGPSPAPVQADVPATVEVSRLATLLGAGTSHDAGTYLCNAWAHDVVLRAPCPAAFIHLPPGGADPQAIAAAIGAYLQRDPGA